LFIPQVIYEHGEPWWNDEVDRRKLLTRPPEFFDNPTNGHLVAKQEELNKGNDNFSFAK
jgi:hypothetical protein